MLQRHKLELSAIWMLMVWLVLCSTRVLAQPDTVVGSMSGSLDRPGI